MRRDLDYLRELLFEVEAAESNVVLFSRTSESDDREIHHVDLLCDAGFLERVSDSGYRLTNSGHDYLDAVRGETVWNKTREGAAAVGGMTLSMMKDLAIAYVKQEAAEKLGIQL
ncbi:DUF2513 domain-containing protein [Arenibacterium sp. CAU 1754]